MRNVSVSKLKLSIHLQAYRSQGELFNSVTPIYKSCKFSPFLVSFGWDSEQAQAVFSINPKRAVKRAQSYIIPEELERVKAKLAEGKDTISIRFGYKKEGRGIKGTRGDFCLIGGVLTRRKKLTLFYRSIELIGGLHYDTTLIKSLEESLGIDLRVIEIYAVEAHAFCLKRNSNEKLHQRLSILYASEQ